MPECNRRGLMMHEAAHAVVGHMFGLRILHLDVRDGEHHGSMTAEASFSIEQWREAILVALAGGTAQLKVERPQASMRDERRNFCWIDDLHKADLLYSRYVRLTTNNNVSMQEEERLLAELEEKAHLAVQALLNDQDVWRAMEAVAAELARNGVLTGDDFRSVVDPLLSAEKIHALKGYARFA